MDNLFTLRPALMSAPRKSLDDVPQLKLGYMAVKVYLIGALVWDYTDTVLDIAAQMRLGGGCKKLARAIREIHKDYDYIRSKDLNSNHVKREWELAELFEDINKETFSRLCNGLINEIRHDTNLDKDYETLVEAVQIAMTVLDALRLYADQCDKVIRKYYPNAPHSILPDHFTKLAMLLPEYAGNCYNRNSEARYITARILLNEINKIELYRD